MRIKNFNYDDFLMLYQEHHRPDDANFFYRKAGKQVLPKVLKD